MVSRAGQVVQTLVRLAISYQIASSESTDEGSGGAGGGVRLIISVVNRVFESILERLKDRFAIAWILDLFKAVP